MRAEGVSVSFGGTVLCDEPTAMLDPIASASVLRSLREISAGGAVVIVVSHDHDLIDALTDRQLSLPPACSA